MRQVKAKPLSQILLANMLLVATLSCVLVGCLWVIQETFRFNADIVAMRDSMISFRKQRMKEQVDSAIAYLQFMRRQTESRTQSVIRERVNEAHLIATHLHEQYKDTRSSVELETMVRETLRPIRFNNGRGYFFATRLDGVDQLCATCTHLEGTDLTNLQDTRGAYVIRDMMELVRNDGEGYYSYTWGKPDAPGKAYVKISFVKLFDPFHWFIGTGEYLDDVEEDLKQEALQWIQTIRYEQEGYVFAGRWDGTSLSGPAIGRKMYEVTDPNGVKIVQEMINASRNDGGFVEYVMPKLEGQRPEPKISYAAGVPEWQWYIGTGLYIDDIERYIAEYRRRSMTTLLYNIGKILVIMLFLWLAVFMLVNRISRKTQRMLTSFSQFFSRGDDDQQEIPATDLPVQEFKELAEAANKMIAKRRSAEQAVRQSEAKNNAILSSLNDIIFEINLNGCFEGYHAPISKKLYAQPDYFLGKKIDEVLPDDVCVLLRQAIESINSGSPYQQFEYHLTIHNTIQWEHAVVTPRYNTANEIIGITAVCRDITERKVAENALRISEAKYREIVENAPIGIFRRELGGKFLYVNPGLIRQLECKTEKELLDTYGLISQRWVNPERSDEFNALLLKNRSVYGYEIETRLVDGTTKWFALYSFLDDSDQFINGFSLDITERKQVEERLGIATHAARIGIWDWDIVKNVLVWDDSMYALYGISKKDFAGAYDAWLHTIHPEDKARAEGEIQATLRNEREYAPEFRILWPDGSIRHIKADSQTFRSQDGKPLRMVGTNIDITEHKRAEEEKARLEHQLRQVQKMESIGTLAGGIAHDFNNILSAIVGFTQLAQMEAKDDPKLSGYLSRVGEATSRATDLVRQILTFSRKSEQQKVPLQISSVAKEALKLLRSSIPTSIEIRQDLATQALVLADPTQVHQIMMNLCTNAYQSMAKTGGVLAVSLKETEILNEKELGGEIKPGRYVVLEVSDTGSGMDKETQEKIFEPYFTTKETGKGTGLGLAVVHGIVNDHQGMINVYSEPGRGTTFRVYLPTTENQMHAVHAKQEEAKPTERHEHILFVDDEEQIRSLAKEYLGNFGYVVEVCSSGRDALFAIEQEPEAYDLLITDMTMPGMNGKELVRKVLALRPDLPVILCTGYSSLIDREDAATIGVSAYVEKPMKMNDLVGRIKAVLKKRNAP